MNKFKKWWKNLRLVLFFAVTVFFILLMTMFLVFISLGVLWRLGITEHISSKYPFFVFAIISLVIGTILAAISGRKTMKPIQDIIHAVDQIAEGDYSVRIHLKGPEEFYELGEKFNHMSKELGSVEMLRSDFVNNFSHEFKTPIVSIRGFAKMLKREDLTTEERNEYLDIIIDESERLTALSTNVLNLSKLEQQSILTDRERINISEQLRRVIAIMDSKCSEKGISFSFDAEESFVMGNQALLKEVWINLLDNAIKFSPNGGEIQVRVNMTEEEVAVYIRNQGEKIAEDAAAYIFDKFYQGDTSHVTRGNGLGLTIARRIVILHGGQIELARNDEDHIVFRVSFPAQVCTSDKG